ncbi:MAG: U32 family peptidase [Bacteroidales bacterium]
MQLRELEILAPAKSIDIGIAATDCGADALYIAGPSFGAREAAGNSVKDVEKLVKYAHRFGTRVYMVINTILYDNEIERARELALKAFEIGCDALIIQDLGLLKAGLPPIPLFASTQTNIRTVEQAKRLESLGFKRLILARELSLEQIAGIRSNTTIELESFIHGALCVSYSGQCYMSSRVTGRSGNRGECSQMCRSVWNLLDNKGMTIIKEKPLLSLKDLNLSEYIPALARAGVTSFKIEGRLKGESYVKNIVRFYRGVVDNFLESDKSFKASSYGKIYGGFTPRPDSTFSRGYTSLFVDGKRGEWNSGESAKSRGEFIGRILKSKPNSRGNLSFRYDSQTKIENGDGLIIIPPDGQPVGIRASHTVANEVFTNERANIIQGSEVYRNYNQLFEKELQNNMPKRLITVKLDFERDSDQTKLIATSEDGRGCEVVIENGFDPARDQQLAKESLYRQLEKISGIYKFEISTYKSVNNLNEEEMLFYPASVLNEMRRVIASKLDGMEIIDHKRVSDKGRLPDKREKDNATKLFNGKVADYRENISNSLSRKLYLEEGAEVAGEAFELSAPAEAELMRCKYCIKYELGTCPSEGSRVKYDEPLWLENGGRRFKVSFDCKNCEMVIFG